MKLFFNYVLCLIALNTKSQVSTKRVVIYSKNKIIGDSLSLNHFFNALDSLKIKEKKTISIVHIGDSHLQADYFSGKLRVLFQEQFGNAGRGLVFPYKIAHTNEPTNFSSSSTTEWFGVRNVLNPNNYDLGISGISIFSKNNKCDLTIKVKNQNKCNYAFNTIDLFSEKSSPKNTSVKNCEYKSKHNSYLSTFKLQDTTHAIIINFFNEMPIDIHGMVLKNDSTGILYHTIGVNGAKFKSYNKTTLFTDQLNWLHPDLIIISLGTNESYDAKFDSIEFIKELQLFVTNVKATCGECSILFTTPADNYKIIEKKIIHNSKPKLVTQLISGYALSLHYAMWNLHEIMGGKGSMKTWYNHKLSTKDHVHFTISGYELQGKLLFDAIMNSYNQKK